MSVPSVTHVGSNAHCPVSDNNVQIETDDLSIYQCGPPRIANQTSQQVDTRSPEQQLDEKHTNQDASNAPEQDDDDEKRLAGWPAFRRDFGRGFGFNNGFGWRNQVSFPGILPTFPSVLPTFPGVLPTFPTFSGVLPTFPGVLPTFPGVLPAYPGFLPATIPTYPGIAPPLLPAFPRY